MRAVRWWEIDMPTRNGRSYHVADLPAARREMPNFLELFWWRHCIYGLLEVDVNIARQFMAEHKARTGESLSFTGYIVFCFARAVDENKSVQSYLKGHRQVVTFEDVDVALPIEREINGTRAPTVHIIRRANAKSFLDIHREIRTEQTRPVSANKGFTPWLRSAMLLPPPLPKIVGALIRAATRNDPTISASVQGTVGVTAVGMFGRGLGGWGITPPSHSVDLIVAGVTRKPVVVGDRIEPREILNLTVGFDHDVVDGAPATRFMHRLVELLETGFGLDEDMARLNVSDARQEIHLSAAEVDALAAG